MKQKNIKLGVEGGSKTGRSGRSNTFLGRWLILEEVTNVKLVFPADSYGNICYIVPVFSSLSFLFNRHSSSS